MFISIFVHFIAEAKITERKKEKVPPRSPKDKPNFFNITDDSVEISWQPSEIPSYGEQTKIWYVVERRCPPSKHWIEIGQDIYETTWVMKGYKPEKDYMFRVRAGNDYGISDPSMSNTLISKPGTVSMIILYPTSS